MRVIPMQILRVGGEVLPLRAAARSTPERGGTGASTSRNLLLYEQHDSTTCSYIPAGAGKMRKHATRATVQRVDSTRSTSSRNSLLQDPSR